MRKKIVLLIVLVTLGFKPIQSQINLDDQLNEITPLLSSYISGYTYDLVAYQGITGLNNISSTAKVLPQWGVGLSFKVGAGIISDFSDVTLTGSENAYLYGSAPSLFQGGDAGTLEIFLTNPSNGSPLVHPFTGDRLGFEMGLLDGFDLPFSVSPSFLPVISLGVGYGTEISASILPGVFKSATSSEAEEGDIGISKDLMYLIGVKHDVFNWFPELSKKDMHLSLSVNYTSMEIEASAEGELFGDMSDGGNEYFSVSNNLSGLNYSSSALGLELMFTKSFSWVDLSAFASYNSSSYAINTLGDIEFTYASNIYDTENLVYADFTVDDVIKIDENVTSTLVGAAVQFNIMRFNIAAKYAYGKESYASLGLGFVFGNYN